MKTKISKKLLYRGSVKNLWQTKANRLDFEFTDAYSVFDWGKMPDELHGKGESLAALGAYFFEQLSKPSAWKKLKNAPRFLKAVKFYSGFSEDFGKQLEKQLNELARKGLKHHYIKRSAQNRIQVQEVKINKPEHHYICGQSVYSYHENDKEKRSHLIPLEVIFRFGLPEGSSLIDRLNADYAQQLGFRKVPLPGDFFEAPIIEFSSKLEESDRILTLEQAINYSGLNLEKFLQLYFQSLCVALWLAELCEQVNIELWDGKLEWALMKVEGKFVLALVDSIGPDELRLIEPKTGAQLSKEFLRQYYRKTPWYKTVQESKKLAGFQVVQSWKDLVRKDYAEPPKLPQEYLEVGEVLYPTLAQLLTGENPQKRAVSLSELQERISQCRVS